MQRIESNAISAMDTQPKKGAKTCKHLLVRKFPVRFSLFWSPLSVNTTTVYFLPAVKLPNVYVLPPVTVCSVSPCNLILNPVLSPAPAFHVTVSERTVLPLTARSVGLFGTERYKCISCHMYLNLTRTNQHSTAPKRSNYWYRKAICRTMKVNHVCTRNIFSLLLLCSLYLSVRSGRVRLSRYVSVYA